MKTQKGKLVVVSAPSGCGKTTLIQRLLERNQSLVRSVSYTTRLPRTGEVNGRDYFFVSEDDFKAKKAADFFLETAKVFDSWYGTSRDFVLEHVANGKNVVLAIDVQGMKQINQKRTSNKLSMISIFILPPSPDALQERLRNRKTENAGEIDRRLREAKAELAQKHLYDFQVINTDIDRAVQELEEIVK